MPRTRTLTNDYLRPQTFTVYWQVGGQIHPAVATLRPKVADSVKRVNLEERCIVLLAARP